MRNRGYFTREPFAASIYSKDSQMTPIEEKVIDGLLKLVEGRTVAFRRRHQYSRHTAKIWLRAGCRCEYCDRSLIEHVMAFYSFQYDHILPKSKYKGDPFIGIETADFFGSRTFTDEELNVFALSCRLCNSIKSGFDPNQDRDVYLGGRPLDAAARSILIQRVRERIGDIRREYDEIYECYRTYLDTERAKQP